MLSSVSNYVSNQAQNLVLASKKTGEAKTLPPNLHPR